MQDPPGDPWYVAIMLTLAAASIVTWWILIVRLLRTGCILPYEPRRPVPWGWPAASVAFAMVALMLPTALAAGAADGAPIEFDASKAAENVLGSMLIQVVFGTVAVVIAYITSSPDWRDLGLPESFDQLLGDVGIGAIACLAAIAPVFGVLVFAQYLDGGHEPSHHPLIEIVQQAANVWILSLASISAVLIAPLVEEVLFRLLLQGFLEKWESEEVAHQLEQPAGEGSMMNDEFRMTNEEHELPADSSFVIRHSSFASDRLPQRGLFGLRYGWLPILVSSVLFALAHFGYGPEPLPIFVLALILGYVYRQTHRMVPCIVAHALFNLITVAALWRLLDVMPQ